MYQPNYGREAQNIHFSVGETGIRLLFGCIILLGLMSYGSNFMENQEVAKSTYWPTTDGKLIEIGEKSIGVPIIGRYLPVGCPYAKYSYSIDSKTYTGEKTAGPCIHFVRQLTFHAPEPEPVDTEELMKKMDREEAMSTGRGGTKLDFSARLKRTMELLETEVAYKPIKVRYEREHPEKSVLDPIVLQSDKSQSYSSGILLLLGGILLGGSFVKSILETPSKNDPSLSIETALAAQRRRR